MEAGSLTRLPAPIRLASCWDFEASSRAKALLRWVAERRSVSPLSCSFKPLVRMPHKYRGRQHRLSAPRLEAGQKEQQVIDRNGSVWCTGRWVAVIVEIDDRAPGLEGDQEEQQVVDGDRAIW